MAPAPSKLAVALGAGASTTYGDKWSAIATASDEVIEADDGTVSKVAVTVAGVNPPAAV